MVDAKEALLRDLSDSIVEMDEEKAVKTARIYIEHNYEPYEAIASGLAHGMGRAGKLYEEEEYYIPELLMCSDALYSGMDVIKPHLSKTVGEEKHKAVIGVVEGDTHDIGKNLVKVMMETEGFDVVDLGRDVPPIDFVKTAKEIGASIIALSTLMTTTMDGMEQVIKLLPEYGLKGKVKVMVGGGPISPSYAKKIGADGYAQDALKAAKMARSLVGEG